jgi:hypothetical protein
MIYTTPDALTGHAPTATYPMLGDYGPVLWVDNITNDSQEEID